MYFNFWSCEMCNRAVNSLVEVEVRVYCSRELSVCSLMSASLIYHAFKLNTQHQNKKILNGIIIP